MVARALILTTVETKAEESAFLRECLAAHAVEAEVVDLSLGAAGEPLGGPGKLARMAATVARASAAVTGRIATEAQVVVGMGGGTGCELILGVMRGLPITFPKVLITTLPFDPRRDLADNSIVLVPTLVDISGLNATLRQVIENAAAMVAGLCRSRRSHGACVDEPSVAVSALGATDAAVVRALAAIHALGQEATVFHANGFGGAALTRFIDRGAFLALVDLTPHEMTRMLLGGAHVDMPRRFAAAGEAGLPQIVLPGGLNFIGLPEIDLIDPAYLERPHYSHTNLFTHVKVTADEMARVTAELARQMNLAALPPHLVVPMGGFSHEDRSGGAIEDPAIRAVFRDVMREDLRPEIGVHVLEDHISGPATGRAVGDLLRDILAQRKEMQDA